MCCFSLLQYGKTALEFAKAFAREVMLVYYAIFLRHWVIVHPWHGIEKQLASSFPITASTLAIYFMCTHIHTHIRIQEVAEVLEVAVTKHH